MAKTNDDSSISTLNQIEPESTQLSRKVKQLNTSSLNYIFNVIINKKQLKLSTDVLKCVIEKDVKINLKELPSDLAEALPKLLVFYIKSWPGWNQSVQYFKGTLRLDIWVKKFEEYISFKLLHLIKKGYAKASEELMEKNNLNVSTKTSSTQTEKKMGIKPLSPYVLNIEGPPTLLNNLHFLNKRDDVEIKISEAKDIMEELGYTEILNWPNVEVEFISPQISFKRALKMDYLRFLSSSKQITTYGNNDNIPKITLEKNIEQVAFKTSIIEDYFMLYINQLDLVQEFEREKIKEIRDVVQEFLKDLKELGPVLNNAIYNKSTVSFNINKGKFFRNKTAILSNLKTTSSVNYNEVLTPKCEITLNYFNASKNLETFSNGTSTVIRVIDMQFLNQLKRDCTNVSEQGFDRLRKVFSYLPTIIYTCLFCNKHYEGLYAFEAILKHIKEIHKSESHVLCPKCHNFCSVAKLSYQRWCHICSGKANQKNLVEYDIVEY